MPLDRRHFLSLAVTGATAGFVAASEIAKANPLTKIKAVAFDGFVVFDPRPIGVLAEELFPGKGADVMAVWRTRQFEYTWLRTLTQSYVDFWQVTMDALAFGCAIHNLELTPTKRDRLMSAYLQLKAWPDVLPTLQVLKDAGIRMAFLTNFTAAMLDANIRSAGLGGFFEGHLSTDKVSAFKPDPRSYEMGVSHFKLPREAIAFTAFAGWDAAGAKRFGYPVVWCNRLNQPVEELGVVADHVASTTVDLPTLVIGRY
ncbi:MAG: haloacid dehalogenase type II [Gammaproteobacteria bacterium]